MPQAIQNAKQILVGGTAATTADNIGGPLFRANTGEIGIFTPAGVRITAAPATTGQKFVLALSRGANQPPLISDVIDGANIKVATVKDNVVAAEQIDAVGYNGTSGSIADVATYAGELYNIKIVFQDFMVGTDSERIKNAYYQSSINDTQADIAIGIVDSAYKNMSREVKNSNGFPPVVAKAIVNTPLANDFPFDNTGCDALVVRHSKQVGFSAAAVYNGGTALAAGDYLRIGSATGTNAAVALLSDVYKVVSVESTTAITLDRPVASVTGTYVDNGGNITVIPAAVGVAANWGIKVEGQEQNFDRVKSRYTKIRFDLQPNPSFGSTAKTSLARAYEGTGSYEAVASLEDFLNTFRGEEFRMGEPYLYNYTAQHLASSATDYSLLSITWDHVISGFQHELSSKEIILAIPTGVPGYVDASADAIDIIIAAIAGVSKIKGDSVATTLAITV